MEIIEAIRTRRSIRSFKPDPVPKKVLEELLDIARWAPSGGNAQPWYFVVLGGKVLDEVRARFEEKMKTSWDGQTFINTHPDLPRRTAAYPESLVHRVESLRGPMYGAVGKPGDENLEEKMYEFRKKCLRFFDAPNAIILCSEDPNPTATSSIGIVSQTICLAALAYGLGTCIMGFTVLWPEIYRELVGIPESKPIVTSIAIGYPDFDVPINKFVRPRESLDAMSEWHGI